MFREYFVSTNLWREYHCSTFYIQNSSRKLFHREKNNSNLSKFNQNVLFVVDFLKTFRLVDLKNALGSSKHICFLITDTGPTFVVQIFCSSHFVYTRGALKSYKSSNYFVFNFIFVVPKIKSDISLPIRAQKNILIIRMQHSNAKIYLLGRLYHSTSFVACCGCVNCEIWSKI